MHTHTHILSVQDKLGKQLSSFPYMFNEAETTPRRVDNTFIDESSVSLLKQLPPLADFALAAIVKGYHDKIQVR